MSDEVSVKFTAEDAALWAAIQRQIAASKQMETSLEGVSSKGRATTRELERFAEQTKKIIATPLQNYEQQVRKLDAAQAAGKLTQEEHAAAVALAQQKFEAISTAASAAASEESKANAELERFAASVKKLVATPLQQYEAEVKKLDAALAADKLTAEEHAAAVGLAEQQYQALASAADGTAAAESRSASEMERFAASVKKLVATPVQLYEAEVKKLDAALAADKLTAEEHAAAVAMQKQQLDAATIATDKAAQANKKLDDELDSLAAKIKSTYEQPWDRFARDIDKIDEALARQKISAEEHAAAMKEAVAELESATLASDKFAQAEEEAAREMDQFVASVKKLNTRPIDEYEKTVQKLRAAQAAGKLTQKEYAAAVQDATAKYTAARREISSATSATGGFNLSTSRVITMATGLVSVATGWKAIRETIELANAAINKHTELAKGSKGHQYALAQAQQEALKNLTGLPTEEKKEVLTQDVAAVTAASGLDDAIRITEALGGVFSVVNDRALAREATTVAAQQVPATPDKLEGIAKGLASVAQTVGATAEESEGFLLQAGGINLISDTEALTKNLAPAIVAGVNQLPKQDPKEAARQIGAAFGVMSNVGYDEKGMSTGTALITLQGKMTTFFKTQAADLAEAQEKKRTHKTLTDKDKEALAVGQVTDPGKFLERLKFFQNNTAAREAMLGDEGFGEQRYREAITQFLTSGSLIAKRFEESIAKVNFDAGTARKSAEEIRTASPDLELMIAINEQKAIQQKMRSRPEMGVAGMALEEVQATLDMTQPAGLIDSTIAEMENKFGKRFAEAMAVNDPKKAFEVQYNRLKLRRNALLNSELGNDATDQVLKQNPLIIDDEQINKLPMAETEKVKLKAIEEARQRMLLFHKKHPEIFKPPTPSAPPSPPSMSNEEMADLFAPVDTKKPTSFRTLWQEPAPPETAQNEQNEFKFRTLWQQPAKQITAPPNVTVPPAVAVPAIPSAPPAIRPSQVSAAPTPESRAAVSQPQAVSRETTDQTRLHLQASEAMLEAARQFASAIDKLKQTTPAPQQLAMRSPRPLPDYSSRARREQAYAAG